MTACTPTWGRSILLKIWTRYSFISSVKSAICPSICLPALLLGVLPRGWIVWPLWAPGPWHWRREPALAPPACGSWLPRVSWGGRWMESASWESCNYFQQAERALLRWLFQQIVSAGSRHLVSFHRLPPLSSVCRWSFAVVTVWRSFHLPSKPFLFHKLILFHQSVFWYKASQLGCMWENLIAPSYCALNPLYDSCSASEIISWMQNGEDCNNQSETSWKSSEGHKWFIRAKRREGCSLVQQTKTNNQADYSEKNKLP